MALAVVVTAAALLVPGESATAADARLDRVVGVLGGGPRRAAASSAALVASRVAMTSMPELVAILHSFVGAAAVLVGIATYLEPAGHEAAARARTWSRSTSACSSAR